MTRARTNRWWDHNAPELTPGILAYAIGALELAGHLPQFLIDLDATVAPDTQARQVREWSMGFVVHEQSEARDGKVTSGDTFSRSVSEEVDGAREETSRGNREEPCEDGRGVQP